MEYRGPQPADYDNVRALNLAFLKLLHDRQRATRLLRRLPRRLQERSATLTVLQRERLAGVPFLLFSCREGDADYWDWLFRGGADADLLTRRPDYDAEAAGLVSAALGFIWQLARQNAYAARLICGATVHWCEQLAERPLLDVVSAAASGNVLKLRSPSDAFLWQKLLHVCTNSEQTVSKAARISALQRVLTRPATVATAQTPLAASAIRPAALRVADEIER